MERVTAAYLGLLERNLAALLEGTAGRRETDASAATRARRRVPADNAIDWSLPAVRVHDLIRGVTCPYPGAFTTLGGRELRVWSAARLERAPGDVGPPGRVQEVRPGEGAVVSTGDGALLVREVQLEGEGPRNASEVLTSPSMVLGG
jgi:methionyl-tRNA formyltransferase